MDKLIILGIAPALICLFYIYIRDKYEKEPWRLLFIGVFFGALLTFPIMQAAAFLMRFMPITTRFGEALFISFAVAAFVEEGLKFVVLYFLAFRNRNLNEPFDGIVYAVFIALGFAAVENLLYVFHPSLGGLQTALMRAAVSVPSHGFFGIIMGYHFALAKFEPHSKISRLLGAFFYPWLIHGMYNAILLSGFAYYFVVFIPFVIIFWKDGFNKINTHLKSSPFKQNKKTT